MQIGGLFRNKRGELAFSTIVIAIVALAVLGILLYFVFKVRPPPPPPWDDLELLKEQCRQLCAQTGSIDSVLEFKNSRFCTFSTSIDFDKDGQIEDPEKDLKCWEKLGVLCTATLVAKVNYCVPSNLAPSDFNPPNKFGLDSNGNPKAEPPTPKGCEFDGSKCTIVPAGSVSCNDFSGDDCTRLGCDPDDTNSPADPDNKCDGGTLKEEMLCEEVSRNVQVEVNQEKCK